MEKLTIKITLNPKNYFDAQLIERLSGEKNMAGTLKGLAYERLAIGRLVVQALPIESPVTLRPVQTSNSESTKTEVLTTDPEKEERRQRREQVEREVDGKLSNLLDKF